MTTTAKKPESDTTVASNKAVTEFNFELWSKQVRPQLIASLQKRGVR